MDTEKTHFSSLEDLWMYSRSLLILDLKTRDVIFVNGWHNNNDFHKMYVLRYFIIFAPYSFMNFDE